MKQPHKNPENIKFFWSNLKIRALNSIDIVQQKLKDCLAVFR
jgi:hypothetical protein